MSPRPSAAAYASSAGLVAVASLVAWLLFGHSQLADVAMVYLLGVVVVAMRFGYGPSLAATVLTAIAFDFFFIPPYWSLEIASLRHSVTFAVMFLVATVVSNLTQRVRESALAQARLADEARRAQLRVETEQLRNSLLSSVSHDLRTPLGVVTGATSALLEPGGPTDERSRRRLLETAHGEALRLNRLVSNLLDMTRLDSGALTVRKETQSLEDVVGAALSRLDDRLEGRDVRVDVPHDLPWVPFDAVLIEQVVINLLENATKYSPGGSPIEISARATQRELEAEVADRGPGVAPGDAERIFDKFYRVREREGGGVGLGLAICRGIVRAHGGRIWVEARDGGGASFRFTLPYEAGERDAKALPPSPDASATEVR